MISIPAVLNYLDLFRNKIKCIQQLYEKLIPKIQIIFNFYIIGKAINLDIYAPLIEPSVRYFEYKGQKKFGKIKIYSKDHSQLKNAHAVALIIDKCNKEILTDFQNILDILSSTNNKTLRFLVLYKEISEFENNEEIISFAVSNGLKMVNGISYYRLLEFILKKSLEKYPYGDPDIFFESSQDQKSCSIF